MSQPRLICQISFKQSYGAWRVCAMLRLEALNLAFREQLVLFPFAFDQNSKWRSDLIGTSASYTGDSSLTSRSIERICGTLHHVWRTRMTHNLEMYLVVDVIHITIFLIVIGRNLTIFLRASNHTHRCSTHVGLMRVDAAFSSQFWQKHSGSETKYVTWIAWLLLVFRLPVNCNIVFRSTWNYQCFLEIITFIECVAMLTF